MTVKVKLLVILSRYLSRDILLTTLAVSVVLLLIFLGGRFARYLADAAAGSISPDVLFTLLLYRIPMILERLLPISLFLAILLVFGRLYIDNEISVLNASGVSLTRLLLASSGAVACVALCVAVLTLFVAPDSLKRAEQVLNNEKRRSELDMLEPGQFLKLRSGGGVVYSGSFSEDRSIMRDIFITRQTRNGDWIVVRSASGHQLYDETNDERYLVLENGYRDQLLPGRLLADRLTFATMQQHLQPAGDYGRRKFQYDTLSTALLLKEERPKFQAVLQWRISLILLVPVVAVLAVGMSRTTPRQGRYIKLLPAMLIYFAYMMSLDVLRHHVSEGELPVAAGYVLTHLPFLSVALGFLYMEQLQLWWRSR